MVIVTGDHECGYLTGPDSDPTWEPLVNNGPFVLPGMEWHSGNHTNSPRDKLLFTPGPLTTGITVKQAILLDLGVIGHEFRRVIVEVREGLLEAAGVSRAEGYEAIPMQGCGTLGPEAVLASTRPPN